MQENRRFCLQVFSGDTVENSFSDVATSTKTCQRYRKNLTKANFRHLLPRLLYSFLQVGQWIQDSKKNINSLDFFAITKNELHCLATLRQNNSFFKTIYRNQRGIVLRTYGTYRAYPHTHRVPAYNTALAIIRDAPGKLKAEALNLSASLGRMVQEIPVLCQAG